MSIARKCDICGSFYSIEDSFNHNGILLPEKDGFQHYMLCRAEDNPEDGSKALVQYDICDICATSIYTHIQTLTKKS